jgi:tetratricopeptide (TPR) repeat protein
MIDPEKGLEMMKRAVELEPHSSHWNNCLGVGLIVNKRWDEALQQFEKLAEMDPSWTPTINFLGDIYLIGYKECERAIDLHRQRTEANPGNKLSVARLGYAYAVCGHREKALALAMQLEHLATEQRASPFQIALVYAGLEETDKAFEFWEAAADSKAPCFFIVSWPQWDSLRNDPRYPEMLRRMGMEP